VGFLGVLKMADATYLRGENEIRVTAAAAISPGDVWQMDDGRAAVYPPTVGAASGDRVTFKTDGQYTFTKTASIVLLDGGRAYWDHSANAVTFRKVNDRDFYLGRVVGDAASADTTCTVNINVDPKPQIDLLKDAILSVPTGTQAAGSTGFGLPKVYGGSQALLLSATNEAQCIDMLSVDRVAVASNPIAEFVVRVAVNGSTSDVDFNFGLANGTHTTDADSITESVFIHVDGGSVNLLAESDDGTTEVAATDTTIDLSAGSAVANRFEVWMDARNPADVQLYIDGVNVLPNSVFVLTDATGPLGLLAHLEKVSGTATAGPIYFDRAELRTMEQ
jgi:predicted RecA/RadA family phage recombinase